MKNINLSEKYVITMYDYLCNYCQVNEKTAFTYCNVPHEKIKEVIPLFTIVRFPFHLYQKEFSYSSFVLLVRDRTGKKLPYINPLLLKATSKEKILECLSNGKDWQILLESLLKNSNVISIPVAYTPTYPGITSKKSYQKKMDFKRRRKEYE